MATLSMGALLAGGSPAMAAGEVPAPGAPMTVTPASGNQFVKPVVALSAPCGVGSTSYYLKIYGGTGASALPADGGLVTNGPQDTGLSTSSPFTVTPQFNFIEAAQDQLGASAQLLGDYVLELTCQDDFSNPLGRFTAPVKFTSNSTYTTPAPPVDPIGTTTTLAVSPAGPSPAGSPVTFTATVSPASGPAAAGTVEFFDGATSLGTASLAGGMATLTTSALGVGTHNITATFTGTGFTSSTSAGTSVVIEATPASATTTTLTVTPHGTAVADTDVTLSATVAVTGGGTPAGSVEFYDGATKIATRALVGGTASYVAKFAAAGVRTLKAVFVPSDMATQQGSEDSEDLAITPAPPGPQYPKTALQNIIVKLEQTGGLTISVEHDTVYLPNFTLDATADMFTSTGPINPVTVTDTRLFEEGWVVNGQATDFVKQDDASKIISSTGLGWDPYVITPAPGSTIVEGPTVAPFQDNGLKSPKVLASAAPGEGRGTTVLGADLLLKAPTTTVPGTYSALLTLTVV